MHYENFYCITLVDACKKRHPCVVVDADTRRNLIKIYPKRAIFLPKDHLYSFYKIYDSSVV